MSFPPYPAYKYSGFEWQGEIPVGWTIGRVKDVFRVISGATPRSDDPLLWDGDVVWVTPSDISGETPRRTLSSQRMISAEGLASCAATQVPPGSIILSTRAPIGSVALADVELCTNQGCKCLVPHCKALTKYFLYVLRASANELNLRGRGTTFLELSADALSTFPLPLPSEDEQFFIADFLDREMAKIDALVAEQERLIELLKEKRQTVISHAATKGLNQNVETKGSGVMWLGEVPEHWGIRKLRQLARLESGHTPSRQRPEYWIEDECVIPWFTLADVGYLRVERNTRIASTNQKISQVGLENSAARLLPSNAVILSRTASVGFSGIIDLPLAVSQDFAAWICKPELDPTYLLFCLRAMKPEFKRLMMGSTHQTIYMPDIEAFRVPFPPLSEQLAIAEFIQTATDEIDTLSTEAKRAIELFKERRSALISAAVTGKIDVRGLAPAILEAA